MEMLALLQASGNVEEGLKYLGVGVAAGAGVVGAGAGMGYLIGPTIASIHRQPEAFEQTRTAWLRRSPSTLWSSLFFSPLFSRREE